MAIRQSQRRVSEIEYENTFTKVYAWITGKVQYLPKRHMHYIGEPINRQLNVIYEKIMKCTDLYLHDKGKALERYRLCESIAEDFKTVISLSYFWWNIADGKKNGVKYVKQNQREYWAEQVNRELRLIAGVAHFCRKKKEFEVPVMKAYSKSEIHGVIFLEKLEELQRIIYRRAIHQGTSYRDAQMEMLMKLSRDAFYNALEGNATMAVDEKQYRKRRRYFSEAIGNLYAMSRPVRELAFNDIWPEAELENICELVTDSLKILQALQNSEKIPESA